MTQLDIYNGALATLGHDQEVKTLTDNTTVRRWCERFYGQDRQELLREIAPQWAREYGDLGLGDTVVDNNEWGYYFQLPVGMLKLIQVCDSSGIGIPFKLFKNYLYANSQNVRVEYIIDVVDTTIFDPLFIRALMCKMAVDIALPLTGKEAIRTQVLKELSVYITDARNMDGQDSREIGVPADPNWWANCRGAKFNPGMGTANGTYFPGSNS